MRIIGGDARGRTLVAPAGEKTRPTQDYVRESLFNIIRWDVEDARVLDLFAGTGALSLEAVSRGARSAVLVDADRAACAAIKKNMETHIFNFDKELYGKFIKIEFIKKTRDEVKFSGVEELSAQIAKDCREAKAFHGL